MSEVWLSDEMGSIRYYEVVGQARAVAVQAGPVIRSFRKRSRDMPHFCQTATSVT